MNGPKTFAELIDFVERGHSAEDAIARIVEDDPAVLDDAEVPSATVSLTFFLRALEWAKEEAKDDVALHRFIDAVSECEEDPIGMDAYERILASLKETTEAVVDERELTHRARKRLRKGTFALPGQRKYPIHDLAHARAALAMVAGARSGKPAPPAVQRTVRAAVYARYPSLRKGKKGKD